MSNELTLRLRIATSNDGTAQTLGQTSEGIKRVSTEAQNASHNMSDMARTLSTAGGQGSASAQRITAGMSAVSTSAQTASRSIYETSGSITAGMASAATSTQISAASIANSLRQASSVGRASMQSMTESMAVNLHTINATLTALDARLAATEAQTVGAMATSTSATTSAAAGFVNLKGIVATLGLGILAKDIFNTNREFESLRMQLDGVMGSAAAGAMAFDASMKWAVKTPFELKDITQAFITLKNFGIDPTDSTMASVTNQASRLGKGALGLTTITQQLGQAWTKGALQMQDMHIMMEAGVPVIDMLKTVTGKTGAEISKMSENGELGRESIKGLIDEMGRLTAGSNEAAMKTLNGQISNLSDAWHNFEDTLLSDKSEGLIKGIVASITDSVNLVTRNMSSSIDAQIAHSAARIKTLNSMGSVGSFISDMTGSDANLEKNRLDGLRRTKAAQDEADRLITINKDSALAIKDTWDWLAEMESDDAAKSDKLAKEKAKKAVSEAESTAKSLQSAYENAVNSMEQSLVKTGDHAKSAAMEYQMMNGALQGLNESKKLYLLQLAAEVDNQALKKKADDAEKSAMDSLIDKYKQLTLSSRNYYASTLVAKGIPIDQQGSIMQQFDKNTAAEASKKSIDDARASLETYNKSLADTIAKTSDLGATNSAIFDSSLGGLNTMTGAFDNMIKSISANTKALEDLHKKQVENASFEQKAITDTNRARNNGQYLVDLKTISDNKAKYTLEEQRLNNETLKYSLSGIRQMAAATGQMFEDNTNARRAFNIISLTASVAERAADLAGLSVKAASAMLTQGQGDPYTAFARIAAMGAIVASILSAAGAGTFNFGGATAAPKPAGSPDTGTVLGDSSAKSNSVGNIYQLLQDIHAEEYATLRSIDKGIADLHSGITDVITRLYQAGGLASVTAPASKITGIQAGLKSIDPIMQMGLDPIGEFILGGIFGGKQTSTVIGQGIATGATAIADIIAGKNLQAQQYAQIQTKTDGGWFGSDSYSTSMQYAALDAATQKALNDVFKSIGSTMQGLADNLGMGLSDRVNNYIIPALTVDLKGLDGEAAAKKLNGVLSAALDTMSTDIFGDKLGQYQQLGEGMLETTVRIVSEMAVVKDSLDKSGLSITGDAIAISDALAQAAGGLKEFQKQFDTYYQKFYTDAERQVFTQKQLNSQLSDVNLLLPATRDGYRKLVEALNINNSADAERYSMLIKLSSAADDYYKVLESSAEADLQIKKQQRALDIQLMELSGNAIGALAEKRKDELASLDASLRFSQQVVWSLQDFDAASKSAADAAKKNVTEAMTILQKAVADEKTIVKNKYDALIGSAEKSLGALSGVISKAFAVLQKSVAADRERLTGEYEASVKSTQSAIDNQSTSASNLLSISKSLKSFLAATVIPGNEANDRISAQRIISDAVASRKLPGEDVLGNALSVLSRPSENLYGSYIEYKLDFLKTSNAIADLSTIADGQLSEAESQLSVAKEQLDFLKAAYDKEIASLDTIIVSAQDQVDAANGTTVAVMTVRQAQDVLTQATSIAGIQQSNAISAQIESYKAASANEIARLDGVLSTAQTQIDAVNGTTVAVMSVESAILNLGAAITAQKEQAARAQAELDARLSAISAAQLAIKIESSKKTDYDAAAAKAAQSQQAVNDAIAAAQKAAQAAQAAQSAANVPTAPAPTTWQNGQSGNPIWERVLEGFNAAHAARFGTPMNRPWAADADAAATYSVLVGQYNALSAAAVQAAQAQAAGLFSVANAAAALIPGYQQTASVDQSAASQAAAQYATAKAYADAAKSAVPNINGFAAGGDHAGGWRVVGENGPELEYTQPSRIFSNSQSKSLVDNSDLIDEVRMLKEEIKLLRASSERGNENTQRTSDTLSGRQPMPLLVKVVS